MCIQSSVSGVFVYEYWSIHLVEDSFSKHLVLGEGWWQVVEDVLNAIFLLKREMLQPVAV